MLHLPVAVAVDTGLLKRDEAMPRRVIFISTAARACRAALQSSGFKHVFQALESGGRCESYQNYVKGLAAQLSGSN